MSRPRKKGKGCNPLVAILVLGAVFLFALVISLFVGKSMLQSWIQGEGFKEWIRSKAAASLHAEVNIEDLKWDGMKANVGSISAEGYEEAEFSSFDLSGIRADFAGVKDKAFKIETINISRGHAEFSNRRLQGNRANESEGVSSDPAGASPKVPGWLSKYAPNRVEIDEIVLGNCSLNVLDDQGKQAMAITGTRATVVPDLESGEMEINATQGSLFLAGAPELDIQNARMRWQDSSLFINDAALGIFESGHVSGDGEIAFGDESLMDLELDLSGIDVAKVVSSDWKSKVTGSVRGTATVKGTPENVATSGTVYLDDGVIQGVPLLEQIAKYTGARQFNRLVLDQAQADYKIEGDLMELSNIQFQSDGLTRIEGGIDKNGDSLSGILRVGVTPGTLRWIPGAEQKVFTENRDGFVWTSVNIGGTVANVREDLSGRILAAAAERLLEELPGGVEKTLKNIVGVGGDNNTEGESGSGDEEITDRIKDILIDRVGDEETIETGKRVFEILSPFLGN